VALLGDIGGTNIRLVLKELNLTTRTSKVILELKKYDSQHLACLQDAIVDFLNQIPVRLFT
jgi:glucokinase